LLGVGLETIKSSFSQLWADQARLKALIKGLTALKDNLKAIKILFTALSNALTGILSDTQNILNTWTDIQTRLATVESVDRNTTDDEMAKVVGDWAKAQEDATVYIDAISGSGATTRKSGQDLLAEARAPDADHIPKIPRTQAELELAALLTSFDLNPDEA
jgi:hypothetical protein